MGIILAKTKKLINYLSTETSLATIAMLTTVIMWGMSFISIKIVVSEIPPVTMAFICFTIATAILMTVRKKIEPSVKLNKSDLLKMMLAGFLGVTAYFYFENTGVKLTTASSASLIISMIPIASILADVIFYKTRITPVKLIGILTSVVGTYFVITANGRIDFSSSAFKGNLMMLGAAMCWVFYTMVNKSFSSKYSGLFLTTYHNLYGTIFLLPLCLLEYRQWQAFSLKAFVNLVFLAIFCSALGYFLYIYALRKLDVTITTLYLNLIPVIGVIGSFFILRETIFPVQVIGGAVIIAGILIVNMSVIATKKQIHPDTISEYTK